MANSLWRPGSKAFFRDQRARAIGDILTVSIEINDSAQLRNETQKSRSGSESMGAPRLFGLEASKLVPSTVNPATLLDVTGDSSNRGSGQIARNEKIALQVAAVVQQVLPNGNLVINGRQEVRVNHEVRELGITGIVRPEDIMSDNRITYEKIADARVTYGGRGALSDVQQPRYGTQILDILSPF